ncbi:MAG: preprotein translocase subunit SecG [Luteolibacter sp.]|uniref:preprotein translocase subunit SecG n=1 Tax=Luteolibacter sp. TaxID=1962973 RepID=UPI003265E9A2
MTFVAASFLNISINVLLLIFVFICFLMTLVILMQRPKQEGLGAAFGGGVTDQVFGARTTNVLQRGTVYLGSLFFILSLILSVLIGQKNKTISTVRNSDTAAKVEAAKPATPAVEVTPKSLKEELPVEDATPEETPTPADVPADAPDATKPAAPVETTPPANTAPPAVEPAPIETPAPPAPADGAPADKPKEP